MRLDVSADVDRLVADGRALARDWLARARRSSSSPPTAALAAAELALADARGDPDRFARDTARPAPPFALGSGRAPDDPGRAPANQRSVRRHNLGVVLRHVAEHGPRSRAAIAQGTGLNKTTVSSLVGELIDFGPRARDRGGAARHRRPPRAAGRARRAQRHRARARARRRLPRRRAPPTCAATSATSPCVDVDNRGRAGRRRCSTTSSGSPATRSPRCGEQGLLPPARSSPCPGLVDTTGGLLTAPEPRLDGRAGRRRLATGSAPRRSRSARRTRPTSARWPSCGRAPAASCATSSTSRASSGIGAGIIVGRRAVPRRARLRRRARPHHHRPRRRRVRLRQPRLPRDAGRARRDAARRAGWTPDARVAELAERAQARRRARAGGARGGRPLARRRRRVGREPAQPARRRRRRLLRHARDRGSSPGSRRSSPRGCSSAEWDAAARRHLGAGRRGRGARRLGAGAAARLRRPGARRRADGAA